MSCHYSCVTCSSSLFADLCSSCPSTRTLIDTTCVCNSGLYEYQSLDCRTSAQIDSIDFTMIIILEIIYWVMLGFSWLSILASLNHVYSAKIRALVSFMQITSLLLDYRYRFTSVAQKGLEIMSVWNFRYFNTLICTNLKSKPYSCESYQNMFGPLLTLTALFLALGVSYIMTKTCILSIFTDSVPQQKDKQGQVVIINRGKQEQFKKDSNSQIHPSVHTMGFFEYIRISFRSFFLLYIDYSIVQWGVQLSRIAYISSVTFLLYIPLIILMISFTLFTLKKINSPFQYKIQYRSQMGYLYVYDQKYHLNYLDYLFEQEQNLNQNSSYTPEKYYPHSNYVILEIVMKFFIASMTIIMFELKPQIWVYPTLFVLFVTFFKMKVFQVYETNALIAYLVGFFICLISYSGFFVDIFFNLWMIIVVFVTTAGFFLLFISDLSDWNRTKEGKYWSLAFQHFHQENSLDKILQDPLEGQSHSHSNQEDQHSEDNLGINKNITGNNFGQRLQQNVAKQSQNSNNPKFLTSKAEFRKNLSLEEKQSLSNSKQQQQRKNQAAENTPLRQSRQNLPQRQQSFMTRTNRSKFGQLSDQMKSSKSRFSNQLNNSLPKEKEMFEKRRQKLPQIIEQSSNDQDYNINVQSESGEQNKSDENLVRRNSKNNLNSRQKYNQQN